MCNINEMKKSAFHSKLDKLIKYQNCFTEKGLQGCSYDEVRNVNSKFKNRVPESVLEFLKKYGIQFSVCSKFNRLYSLLKGYDKVQEYLRTDLQECYKLEEYEIVPAAQAVDPLEIELDNVLIVDFYNGQTPSINFVKLDEEADPIIYEICEGEIMNCKISFSQYVYQTFAYNLEHYIQRIDYSKVFLYSFNFKNEYFRFDKIKDAKIRVDLSDLDALPLEIQKNKFVEEISLRNCEYQIYTRFIQANQDNIKSIELSKINNFPTVFTLPYLPRLTSLTVKDINTETIRVLQQNTPLLRRISIWCSIESTNQIDLDKLDLEFLNNLTELSINGVKISQIPAWVFEQINLERLRISGCGLIKLDERIRLLRKLKHLDIGENNLKEDELKRIKKKFTHLTVRT